LHLTAQLLLLTLQKETCRELAVVRGAPICAVLLHSPQLACISTKPAPFAQKNSFKPHSLSAEFASTLQINGGAILQ
jgi:hypothetical protein